MNTEFEFQYGCSGTDNWERVTVISNKPLFYDVLTENGVNVVLWSYSRELLTYVEIDSDNLPTGRVFQLIKTRKIVEPLTGGICL